MKNSGSLKLLVACTDNRETLAALFGRTPVK